MTETEITCAVALYLSKRGLLFTHVANERRCTPRRGYQLKLQGVLAGVSDIIIFNSGWRYECLLLELKTEKGRLSEAQQTFQSRVIKESPHLQYAVARSLENAINIVEEYLNAR
jgi:hypothetical protein